MQQDERVSRLLKGRKRTLFTCRISYSILFYRLFFYKRSRDVLSWYKTHVYDYDYDCLYKKNYDND